MLSQIVCQTLPAQSRSILLKRAALLSHTARARQATTVASSGPQSTEYIVEGFKYVPGGPIYKGTINDPTQFPPASRAHGSHHWAFERLLSAALVPITAASAITSSTPYPVLDGILALSLVVHSHIGFDAMLVDYLHPRKWPVFGPIIKWFLRATTAGVLVGVYQFNTNDVGLTELIKRVWTA